MYHVLFSHVSRTFFSLISSQTLDITDFLNPPKYIESIYKVSMKVSTLEKKALFFFNFSKKIISISVKHPSDYDLQIGSHLLH